MRATAKEIYKALDQIIRRGYYEASLECDDSADLIMMNAYNDARQQVNCMWYCGAISDSFAEQLDDWFGFI